MCDLLINMVGPLPGINLDILNNLTDLCGHTLLKFLIQVSSFGNDLRLKSEGF
jgi:hypothetical protein